METRIGGSPSLAPGAAWPTCKSCKGPMTFVAQVGLGDAGLGEGALALFQCMNQPGMCDDWDANAGGNAALHLGSSGLAPVEPPAALKKRLPAEAIAVSGGKLSAGGADAGRIGGAPEWLQADETPACKCGQKMAFVAQLTERGKMNFGGGGQAYAFACSPCKQGRFLWQQ